MKTEQNDKRIEIDFGIVGADDVIEQIEGVTEAVEDLGRALKRVNEMKGFLTTLLSKKHED